MFSVVNLLKLQYIKDILYSLEKFVLTTYYILPCNAIYNTSKTTYYTLSDFSSTTHSTEIASNSLEENSHGIEVTN